MNNNTDGMGLPKKPPVLDPRDPITRILEDSIDPRPETRKFELVPTEHFYSRQVSDFLDESKPQPIAEERKPDICGRCAGDALVHQTKTSHGPAYFVECPACRMCGAIRGDKDAAITHWNDHHGDNRRAGPFTKRTNSAEPNRNDSFLDALRKKRPKAEYPGISTAGAGAYTFKAPEVEQKEIAKEQAELPERANCPDCGKWPIVAKSALGLRRVACVCGEVGAWKSTAAIAIRNWNGIATRGAVGHPLPCPHCGRKPQYKESGNVSRYQCPDVCTEQKYWSNRTIAKDQWNAHVEFVREQKQKAQEAGSVPCVDCGGLPTAAKEGGRGLWRATCTCGRAGELKASSSIALKNWDFLMERLND